MKDSDRLWEEHEKNGTDPLDDPAFIDALNKEDDIPTDGTQWNPDWINERDHSDTSSTSK